MNGNTSVTWEPTPDVLNVWLDSPNRRVNVLDVEMIKGLESVVDHIRQQDQYRVIVFRSRKPDCFIAGADVTAIAKLHDPDQIRTILQRGQELMQQIEDLTPVTVAAIDGSCLGGGLELALACRYRIASTAPHTRLGAPEIRLGLIPGWGGTQRLPKKVGLIQALKMILKGSSVAASNAHSMGLVDELVRSDNFNQAIDQRIALQVHSDTPTEITFSQSDSPVRRPAWTDRLLDGTTLGRWATFHFAERNIRSQKKHFPAIEKAMEAMKLAFDSNHDGYQFERDAFAELLFTSTAQSLIGLFVQRDRAKKQETWLTNFESLGVNPIRRLAVIGAGAMGAGIGGLAALNGINVVFKEVNDAAAEAGSKRIAKLFESQKQQRRITSLEENDAMQRVAMTTEWDEIEACEIAIEAVLEVDSVKRGVFQMLDQALPTSTAIATNTSSLNVTKLAEATKRPEQIAGLHFFNPVERMELVEIVRTEITSERTLAQMLLLARQLGKTPIVTADQPGFIVNRILFPYLGEAVRMVAEGTDIKVIDRELKQFGMPMGPLELIDQVGVDIASHVANSLRSIQSDSEISTKLLKEMAEKNWLGKKSGVGFYQWDNAHVPSKSEPVKTKKSTNGSSGSRSKSRSNHKRQPNQDLQFLLKHIFTAAESTPPSLGGERFKDDGLSDIQRRLVYPMLNEAVHCLDQQVVSQPWMVDLAMVLGTGFAPMYGGPLRLIDLIGVDVLKTNMLILQSRFGKRFEPAVGLQSRAASGGSFFEKDSKNEQRNTPVKPSGSEKVLTASQAPSH